MRGGLAGRTGIRGSLEDKRHPKGGRERRWAPETFVSDVSAYLLSFLGQWGPAVYLCYKVGLAKANTLVYEAGEWPFCPSYPLTLHGASW